MSWLVSHLFKLHNNDVKLWRSLTRKLFYRWHQIRYHYRLPMVDVYVSQYREALEEEAQKKENADNNKDNSPQYIWVSIIKPVKNYSKWSNWWR